MGSYPGKSSPLLRIAVDDDDTDPVRRDTVSADMLRVHPDLPIHGTSEERRRYLRECDARAYSEIRDDFPQFTPPSESKAT